MKNINKKIALLSLLTLPLSSVAMQKKEPILEIKIVCGIEITEKNISQYLEGGSIVSGPTDINNDYKACYTLARKGTVTPEQITQAKQEIYFATFGPDIF